MGHSLSTECLNCGHKDELVIGAGFLTPRDIDSLVNYIKNKKEKSLLTVLNKRFKVSFLVNPGYELYWCHSCNTLHSKLHYVIKYGDDSHYTRVYTCSKCNNILIKIPEETELVVSNHNCKRCGQTTLEESLSQILWD